MKCIFFKIRQYKLHEGNGSDVTFLHTFVQRIFIEWVLCIRNAMRHDKDTEMDKAAKPYEFKQGKFNNWRNGMCYEGLYIGVWEQ